MGLTIAQKIIKSHLVAGEMIPGQEIGLKIDQTLTQDATGTIPGIRGHGPGPGENRAVRGLYRP